MTDNNTNQFDNTSIPVSTPTIPNTPVVAEKAEQKKVKKAEVSLKTIDKPVRQLPKIINELIEKNFSIVLNQKGYFVEGFYGISNETSFTGYIFAQETSEPNTLVFFDAKGHKHYIKSFDELVALNSVVWGQFYKVSDAYKKPNAKWFSYMLESGVLNITPGK